MAALPQLFRLKQFVQSTIQYTVNETGHDDAEMNDRYRQRSSAFGGETAL